MDPNKTTGKPASSWTADDHKSTPKTRRNSTSMSSSSSDGSTRKRRRSEEGFARLPDPSVVAATSTETEEPRTNETIYVPRYKDILLGRGRGIQTSNGNYLMREIIRKYRAEYTAARRSQRREIAERVLDEILATGARFLRRLETDTGREMWHEVDRALAHEKVSHALREKKYTGASNTDEESSSLTRNRLTRHQSQSPPTFGLNSPQHDQQTSSRIPQEFEHPYSSLPPGLPPTTQPSPPSLFAMQQIGLGARMPFQSVPVTFYNSVANTRLESRQSNTQQHNRIGTTSTPYSVDQPSFVAAAVLESLIHQHTTDIASASQNLLAGALDSHYQVGSTMSNRSLLAGSTISGGGFPTAAAAGIQQFPQAAMSPGLLALLLTNNNALLPPLAVQALQQETARQMQLVGLNDDRPEIVGRTALLASRQNYMFPPPSASEGPPEAGSRIPLLARGAFVPHSSTSAGSSNARDVSNPFPSLRDNVTSLYTAEAASPMNDDESNEPNTN